MYKNLTAWGRKQGIPLTLVEQRKKFIISLHLIEYSSADILKEVNEMNGRKFWDTITLRRVQEVIKEYKDKHPLSETQARYLDDWLREAHIARMEKLIEAIALEIKYKYPEWWKGRYGYSKAIKTLYDMNVELMILKGWAFKKTRSKWSRWFKFNQYQYTVRPKSNTNQQHSAGMQKVIDELDKQIEQGHIDSLLDDDCR